MKSIEIPLDLERVREIDLNDILLISGENVETIVYSVSPTEVYLIESMTSDYYKVPEGELYALKSLLEVSIDHGMIYRVKNNDQLKPILDEIINPTE